MKKVLAIVGPTAVGKTATSIKLAKRFDGEVISGDSMQVYRKLDIGTAKITADEKQGIVHHLIDIRDIDQRFSVADFVNEANEAINQITAAKKLPIIVGGTGFYLQALLNGLALGGAQFENDQLRLKLLSQAKLEGNEVLHQRLEKVDQIAAEQIPVNNVRRVIRALEVYIKTGHRFSAQTNHPRSYDAFIVGLTTDRPTLYERINQRVDQMMDQGLLDEARYVYQNGGTALQAGKGIGYHEFDPYFSHDRTLAEAVALVKKGSRHYAKRQLTWFRNKTKPHWYDIINDPGDVNRLNDDVKKWLETGDQPD